MKFIGWLKQSDPSTRLEVIEPAYLSVVQTQTKERGKGPVKETIVEIRFRMEAGAQARFEVTPEEWRRLNGRVEALIESLTHNPFATEPS